MGAKNSIAAQLDKARLILEGAQAGGEEMTDRLAQVGYDADALAAGYALYEEAGGARIRAYAERGDQKGATANVNALREKVEGQFKTLEQISKTVFANDPDAYQTLGLGQGVLAQPRTSPPEEGAGTEPVPAATPRLSEAQAAFFDRATILYKNALDVPEIAAELEKVGYPAARLQTELDELDELKAADVQQEAEKAESKASTAAQKEALKQLNDWLKRFTGIVVPALKDRPDLLAKMGLKPRGGRRS